MYMDINQVCAQDGWMLAKFFFFFFMFMDKNGCMGFDEPA